MLQTLICYAISLAVILTFWILVPSFFRLVAVFILALGSTAYIWFLLAKIFDHLLPRRRVSPLNKAVFITGCDTGFGHSLAKRLDSLGYKVFAGCLHPDGTDAEKLKSATSSNLTIIGVDVTNDQSVQHAVESVSKELQNAVLWAVVNNAGIVVRGDLEWMQLEDYKKQFEVNTFGVVRVTQAFLPLLRKYKGRVVATTSHGGRCTFTGFVPYCMTKYASTSFCEGLRREMEKWDVKVITVEPFIYRTPLTDKETLRESLDSTWSKAPEKVKEEYGPQYIDKCKEASIKFHDFGSSNINKVISCLEEAVTAYSPHNSYTSGDLLQMTGEWFLRRAPPTIENAITKMFITFDTYMESYVRERLVEMESNKKMT